MNGITIDGRNIGPNQPPYVIAELSANHNGSLETALRIIDEAVIAGADAVKLQTYRAETITLDSDSEEFVIRGGLWDGKRLHDLYTEAHMPWDWHQPLFDHARKRGITIFSSPFDSTAIDLLEDLNVPAYKIASFEAVDLPLIRYAASTGKPMIISTGMADAEEIGEAVAAAKDGGCRELANLRTIPDMVERFGLVTGLSDHTLDNTTAIASVVLGASIIEKHFTLNRNGGGPDDSFSLEPPEMKALCQGARTAWEALGRIDYGRKSSEQGNVQFRRSLYFVKDLKAGEVITPDSVRSVRPGYGLAPKYLEKILNAKVKQDVSKHSAVTWEKLKSPEE